jgi:hypothetical protein
MELYIPAAATKPYLILASAASKIPTYARSKTVAAVAN